MVRVAAKTTASFGRSKSENTGTAIMANPKPVKALNRAAAKAVPPTAMSCSGDSNSSNESMNAPLPHASLW
jgi:hypothetical protein